MNIRKSDTPSPEGQKQLEALRQAVSKTLEKKRRLGQYAVTWKEGKPVITGEFRAQTLSSDELKIVNQ